MSRGLKVSDLLRPLEEKPIQAYFGQGLHSLGLLRWILEQTGKADVWVSSYSTSEPFLNGFIHLKEDGLVRQSMILLDQRACTKTVKLERLLANSFDHVMLGQNHSKITLVCNVHYKVAVITSQNQTYGARAESTIVTTDDGVFNVLLNQFIDIAGNMAAEIDVKNGNGIIATGAAPEGGGARETTSDPIGDCRPFGY